MPEDNRRGPGTDAIDTLTTDHKEMIALLGEIEHTSDAGQRRDLAEWAKRCRAPRNWHQPARIPARHTLSSFTRPSDRVLAWLTGS